MVYSSGAHFVRSPEVRRPNSLGDLEADNDPKEIVLARRRRPQRLLEAWAEAYVLHCPGLERKSASDSGIWRTPLDVCDVSMVFFNFFSSFSVGHDLLLARMRGRGNATSL